MKPTLGANVYLVLICFHCIAMVLPFYFYIFKKFTFLTFGDLLTFSKPVFTQSSHYLLFPSEPQ